jgi:hypothetical protein
MSNIISTKPKPQAPQAAPDGNAVASLILGILGIAVIPASFTVGILGVLATIGSVLAVIVGSASIGDAYKRGERGSIIATAGADLGWIGAWFPAVLFASLAIFTPHHWFGVLAFVFLVIDVVLMYYTRRNYRR